jgi:hypothetical protein
LVIAGPARRDTAGAEVVAAMADAGPMGRVRRERTPSPPRLDYHDPTAGIGGAAPAASALTLRLWLAGAAIAGCIAGIVLTIVLGGSLGLVVILAIVAATAVLDVAVITRRKHRGEAG